MVVLDAYALIAFLANEPAADAVEGALRSQDAAMSTVNLAEAADVLQRTQRFLAADVEAAYDAIGGEIDLRPASEREAWRAGRLRARHYHRRSKPLSLADCFLLATARPGDSVATADPHVAEVAQLEEIGVVPLPDSSGRRP